MEDAAMTSITTLDANMTTREKIEATVVKDGDSATQCGGVIWPNFFATH
jgi:hypothetical protein